jgi:proteasome accessory factor C
MRRLLVMLPWLMERGSATLAEMCERFQVSERDLVADLEQAAMCGLPPFLDEVVDLYIDEGVAYVGVPRFFTRPLRLTAPEGFSLMVAGRAALSMPGADPDGPLARALAKLEAVLGDDAMVVDLAQPPATADVIAAVDDRARLAVSYWSASSDEVTDRVITPRAVFADRGRWYVVADDDRSGEQRTFRLDRFVTWERTGERAPATDDAAPVVPSGDGWFDDVSEQSTVTLRVLPAGWRVLERLPVRSVDDDGEHMTVAMAVTSERWLRQLLMRLGPTADVVSPDAWRELAADAATELLATRYAAD